MTIFFLAFTYKSGLVPSAVTRWPCKKLCKTRVKWFPIQNHHFTFIFNSSDLYYVFNPLVENECLGSPLDGHSVAAGSWKKKSIPEPMEAAVCVWRIDRFWRSQSRQRTREAAWRAESGAKEMEQRLDDDEDRDSGRSVNWRDRVADRKWRGSDRRRRFGRQLRNERTVEPNG